MNSTPFESRDLLPDSGEYQELLTDLNGRPLLRCDKLYGGALSLHLGPPIPANHPRAREPDRGSWIVTAWGCDITCFTSDCVLDSVQDEPEQIHHLISKSLHTSLVETKASWDPLALELTLSDGLVVRMTVDPAFDSDAWILSLPNYEVVAIHNWGTWAWEQPVRGGQVPP